MVQFKNGFTAIEDSNDAKRELVHLVSNESVDSYKDVLISKGIDVSRWRAVLYQHNYGSMGWFSDSVQLPSELIPGKKLWEKTENKKVLMKFDYVDTTLGNELYIFYKGGYMSGLSVGWCPKGKQVYNKETGITTYEEWYCYEVSHVLFPANFDTGNIEDEEKSFSNLELMKKESKDTLLKEMIYKEYDYMQIKRDLRGAVQNNNNLKSLLEELKTKTGNSEEIIKLNNEISEIKTILTKKTVESVVKKPTIKSVDFYKSAINGALSEITGKKYR